MNPLNLWFSWRARKRAEKVIREAEKARWAGIQQMKARKAAHRESKPLLYVIREATNRSLAASVKGGR